MMPAVRVAPLIPHGGDHFAVLQNGGAPCGASRRAALLPAALREA